MAFAASTRVAVGLVALSPIAVDSTAGEPGGGAGRSQSLSIHRGSCRLEKRSHISQPGQERDVLWISMAMQSRGIANLRSVADDNLDQGASSVDRDVYGRLF